MIGLAFVTLVSRLLGTKLALRSHDGLDWIGLGRWPEIRPSLDLPLPPLALIKSLTTPLLFWLLLLRRRELSFLVFVTIWRIPALSLLLIAPPDAK